MSIWDDVRADVRGDLWRRSVTGLPDDVIDRWLHTSLREIEGKRSWLWLEQVNMTYQQTGDAPASFSALPPSVSNVRSMAYTGEGTPDFYEVLTRVPLQIARTRAQGSNAGVPSCYAIGGLESGAAPGDLLVYFDCVISMDATFEMVCQVRTPILLDSAIEDEDNNMTLNRERAAVTSLTCHYVALNFLKDEDNAARHRIAWERHEDRLLEEEDAARDDLNGSFALPDATYYDAAHGYGAT